MTEKLNCRAGCGACCIAPTISSAIPGMPNGKPAGMRCVQLTANNQCRLFGKSTRPAVCIQFNATAELCGTNFEQALKNLTDLEVNTTPSSLT
ncbi:MAG: YkgJ family cysteine cluster protein [Gammaproteobacteria bacterium]|jgi:Fe-S-cluster containining protein